MGMTAQLVSNKEKKVTMEGELQLYSGAIGMTSYEGESRNGGRGIERWWLE